MLGADVVTDPLRRGTRSGRGGGVAHVRESGLVEQLVGGGVVAAWCRAARRRLCIGIRLLVALNLIVGGYPADSNLVVASEDEVADLDRRNGESLARADVVGPHPLNGGGGVGEERVASPAPVCSTSLSPGAAGIVAEPWRSVAG